MGANEVSSILWRERQLLDLLLFKLEEEQLLLAAGKGRWLAQAAGEVEQVLEQLRLAELARAVEVDRLGRELGLEPNPSLRQLGEVSPPPWGGIFEDHRQAFLEATQEIMAVAQANRELITSGQRAVHETLTWLGAAAPGTTYGADGAVRAQPTSSLMLDQAF
jgi:hypothetical protein